MKSVAPIENLIICAIYENAQTYVAIICTKKCENGCIVSAVLNSFHKGTLLVLCPGSMLVLIKFPSYQYKKTT